MKQWNSHSMCETCWAKREPERVPVRLVDKEFLKCCFCGEPHNSGIFVREHISKTPHCDCEES